MASRIKEARRQREWSQPRLIAEMEKVAARQGKTLPGRETLKSRVSRWENNHAQPDDFYRRLLREALGLDDEELGIVDVGRDDYATAADELRSHLVTAIEPDSDLLTALSAQTEAVRRQDRQYGAAALQEQMRHHVANVEQHLSYAAMETVRRPLAGILADAASLTAWQALDQTAVHQAWRYFETASRAAEQAQDEQLFAFARMEQAHVLGDLDEGGAAANFGAATWARCEEKVGPSMRCWLAAASAEMHALAGDGAASRHMLYVAEAAADRLDDSRPTYLVFDATHLARWIGHTLALLGDPAAELRLRQVKADMDRSFTRAGAALHLDLARALMQRGAREEAKQEIAHAESLAHRVGSRRQLARARKLRGSV